MGESRVVMTLNHVGRGGGKRRERTKYSCQEAKSTEEEKERQREASNQQSLDYLGRSLWGKGSPFQAPGLESSGKGVGICQPCPVTGRDPGMSREPGGSLIC